MSARPAALHGLGDLAQGLQGGGPAAVQHVGEPARGGGEPQLARAALSGGLGGQPVGYAEGLAERAGVRPDRQDGARAERAPTVARDSRETTALCEEAASIQLPW